MYRHPYEWRTKLLTTRKGHGQSGPLEHPKPSPFSLPLILLATQITWGILRDPGQSVPSQKVAEGTFQITERTLVTGHPSIGRSWRARWTRHRETEKTHTRRCAGTMHWPCRGETESLSGSEMCQESFRVSMGYPQFAGWLISWKILSKWMICPRIPLVKDRKKLAGNKRKHTQTDHI